MRIKLVTVILCLSMIAMLFSACGPAIQNTSPDTTPDTDAKAPRTISLAQSIIDAAIKAVKDQTNWGISLLDPTLNLLTGVAVEGAIVLHNGDDAERMVTLSYAEVNNNLAVDREDGVLNNDSNAQIAILVRTTQHGLLNLRNDGSFRYFPVKDFEGIDTFIYKASDGKSESNLATVTIYVNQPLETKSENTKHNGDTPVANNDFYSTLVSKYMGDELRWFYPIDASSWVTVLQPYVRLKPMETKTVTIIVYIPNGTKIEDKNFRFNITADAGMIIKQTFNMDISTDATTKDSQGNTVPDNFLEASLGMPLMLNSLTSITKLTSSIGEKLTAVSYDPKSMLLRIEGLKTSSTRTIALEYESTGMFRQAYIQNWYVSMR